MQAYTLIMADEVSVLFGVVLKKDNVSLIFVKIFARHLVEVNYLFANQLILMTEL
jgi:hypothetical protein